MNDSPAPAYRVLARKYRPESLSELVGQEAMVRVLKNAFAAGRIAQAFILTGIRGTGKTTTARIIAKGLNCIGPDGQGGPTTQPCGVCEHCVAISEGRHVDVMEMDAASRTGVGDIREIIESVHYRAASARYKIYIIDEVHMLSTSAFNALLKTLEEPPEHVKFIFATTEIRKVPVTVLSRCQRFDLRRIEPEAMLDLLRRIAKAEGGEISEAALALIVRAAEGSARDATSLLDQALGHGAGEVGAEAVRSMLGLADRARVMDLFEMILRGQAAAALGELGGQYADGADPLAVLRDLAELTHWVSVVKITPESLDDPTVSPEERARGQALAEGLPMSALSRMWQMLLVALEEVAQAPNAMMAAEMAVIRLTHVAELPSPEELLRRLKEAPRPAPGGSGSSASTPASSGPSARSGSPVQDTGRMAEGTPVAAQTRAGAAAGPAGARAAAAARALQLSEGLAPYTSFAQVLDLISERRDIALKIEVEDHLRLARYAPGRIEFTPTPEAPRDLAPRLARRLQEWTGARWTVTVVPDCTAPTEAERRENARLAAEERARAHPLVQAVLAAFPGAKLTVHPPAPPQAETEAGQPGAPDASDGDEADWDPFEQE